MTTPRCDAAGGAVGWSLLLIGGDARLQASLRAALAEAVPAARLTCPATPSEAGTLPRPDLLFLPLGAGAEPVACCAALWPGTAIIALIHPGAERVIAAAMQAGAADCLRVADVTPSALRRSVGRAIELAELEARVAAQRRELELFCEVLVHDIRAPVRAAGYLAECLVDEAETADRATLIATARMLQRSTAQMAALVQSLAAHAGLEQDLSDPRHLPFVEVVEATLAVLDRDIVESGAGIEIDDPGLSLDCHPAALVQVLQNLVGNAIKYAGAAPPRIGISARSLPGAVLIAVADRGPGVPEAQAERIFEPFVRLSRAGATAGSGLGLATCRKLIERDGGTIRCLPNPGGGSRFEIRLPQPPADAPEASSATVTGEADGAAAGATIGTTTIRPPRMTSVLRPPGPRNAIG